MNPRVPPARLISHLLTAGRDHLTKADAVTVATIENAVPALAVARGLLERFNRMARARCPAALTLWLTDAAGSLMASFGKGIAADGTAVRAALTLPWSNGQTEGQITKLKLVKRRMYGRAKLDLLCAAFSPQHNVHDPSAPKLSQSPSSMPDHTSGPNPLSDTAPGLKGHRPSRSTGHPRPEPACPGQVSLTPAHLQGCEVMLRAGDGMRFG